MTRKDRVAVLNPRIGNIAIFEAKLKVVSNIN